jgi:L-seryl-tRNA(Ser) seleniumtransferase
MSGRDSLRAIPSVELVMNHLNDLGVGLERPRPLVVRAVRELLDREREAILRGDVRGANDEEIRARILSSVVAEVGSASRGTLVPVINATGVVVHTNLGRAPLSERALRVMSEVASGYCNLEYDLSRGERGRRDDLVREALCELSGAEDALVVNNNAAAVMLTLNTLSAGRETIVSRGELIEIGGSFRLPDVFERSGSRMVEVGTTNRTRVADYENAIRSSTGALLSAHLSNYTISGFVERVPLRELVSLGDRYGIPVIHDLGSGILGDPDALGLAGETSLNESVAAGPAASTFSGDKMLGGPQAGIVVGRANVISRMRANPLMRALRPGKLTLGALQATLYSYLDGSARTEIPVQREILEPLETLSKRAAKIVETMSAALNGRAEIKSVELESRVGGGAAPERAIPSRGVAITPGADATAAGIAGALLSSEPPVIVRTRDDAVVFDLRTVREEDDAVVVKAVLAAFRVE